MNTLRGNKERFLHYKYVAYCGDPANPPMTLAEFAEREKEMEDERILSSLQDTDDPAYKESDRQAHCTYWGQP